VRGGEDGEVKGFLCSTYIWYRHIDLIDLRMDPNIATLINTKFTRKVIQYVAVKKPNFGFK